MNEIDTACQYYGEHNGYCLLCPYANHVKCAVSYTHLTLPTTPYV